MRLCIFIAALLSLTAPALAQAPSEVVPAGARLLGGGTVIEQELPAHYATPNLSHADLAIRFARAETPAVATKVNFGRIDSGEVSLFVKATPEKLPACQQALARAFDKLADEARKRGATAIVGTASWQPDGYVPATARYLCTETMARGESDANGLRARGGWVLTVRLVGEAATLR